MKRMLVMAVVAVMAQAAHAVESNEVDESGVMCRNLALQVSHSVMHIQSGIPRPTVEEMAIDMQGSDFTDFALIAVNVAYIMSNIRGVTPDIAMVSALERCRAVEARKRLKLKQM